MIVKQQDQKQGENEKLLLKLYLLQCSVMSTTNHVIYEKFKISIGMTLFEESNVFL